MQLNRIKLYQLNNARPTEGNQNFITAYNGIEVLQPGEGIFLSSPDGSRWKITVSNTGQIEINRANPEV
jgi:hypothetical protein